MQPIEPVAQTHSPSLARATARPTSMASGGHVVLGALGVCLGLCVAITACSTEDGSGSGSGGQGGEASGGDSSTAVGGTGGAGGNTSDSTSGGTTSAYTYAPGPAACVSADKWSGVIATPNPKVDVEGKTIAASPGLTSPEKLFDGTYGAASSVILTANTTDATTWTEAWVSIHLGADYSKLMLVWHDASPNKFTESIIEPLGYVVETSSDSTDGDGGTWTPAVTVTDNTLSGRSHIFDFTGQSWLRFRVTAAPEAATDAGGLAAVRLSELDLFDVASSTEEGTRDGILFMGDSITQMSLGFNASTRATDVDTLINAERTGFNPAMINAGVGGDSTAEGAAHATAWLNADAALDYFPGLDFVTVALGTNDAWGNNSPTTKNYEATLRTMIETIQAAGKTPILARIPYATVATRVLPDYNQIIQDLTDEYELPCGPDLYTYFAEHQDELADDGVHPTSTGQASIRRLYAEALLPLYATE